MKTAEEVARETLGPDKLNGIGYEQYLPYMVEAIERDRAQRGRIDVEALNEEAHGFARERIASADVDEHDLSLNSIPALAADYIEEHGWTAGEMQNEDGAVCLHGAIRACTPQKGDAEIVRAVARAKGYTESWNDTEATEPEVLDALRGLTVTDAELLEVFGPQWREIVALVRRAAVLTEDEAARLGATWDAPVGAAWDVAWAVAEEAAEGAAVYAAAVAAVVAARHFAQAAARAAAGALAMRDLVGQHGFTQEHYDTLTGPWRSVIGPIHEGDAA